MTRRVIIAAVLALAVCAQAAAQQAASSRESSSKRGTAKAAPADAKSAGPALRAPELEADYVIGPDDVLAINVWKEPEVSRTVAVRPDGKISLPLVGETQAAGLQPKELEKKLTTELEKFIEVPEVTVMVQTVNSLKFNIIGEVARPGAYPLRKPMTVLDAIALAGGLSDFANGKKIYILRRRPDGSTVRMPFNYKNVLKGRDISQNWELETRDTIVVP